MKIVQEVMLIKYCLSCISIQSIFLDHAIYGKVLQIHILTIIHITYWLLIYNNQNALSQLPTVELH